MNDPVMKIEHGIPPPTRNKQGVVTDIAKKMDVGDSVLCATDGKALSLKRTILGMGFDAVTSRERQAGISGHRTRVWKIEKRSG